MNKKKKTCAVFSYLDFDRTLYSPKRYANEVTDDGLELLIFYDCNDVPLEVSEI